MGSENFKKISIGKCKEFSVTYDSPLSTNICP
jgi:hypothetical protein